MTVRVLFFSVLRDLTGVDSCDLTLESSEARVKDVLEILLSQFPRLEEWEEQLLLAVNCEYAEPEDPLSDGCEFAVFPPVQGG